MFNKVLMVCLGNICRSPAAEGILKHHFEKTQFAGEVASAGIHAMVDWPASEHSQTVMQQRGIDISNHRAQQLTQQMLIENDLILVMEEDQKRHIEREHPFSRGKVQCIGRWQESDVIDPYQKPLAAFEQMAQHIESCLNDWIERYFKAKE